MSRLACEGPLRSKKLPPLEATHDPVGQMQGRKYRVACVAEDAEGAKSLCETALFEPKI